MSFSLDTDNVESGFKCFWRIENFALTEPRESLKFVSQRFKVNMIHNSEWHLEIEKDLPNKVGIFLFRDEKGDTRSNTIHFTISLLKCLGWIEIISDTRQFKAGGQGFGNDLMEWDETVSPKYKSIPTESLTVCLHMWNGQTSTMSAQCFMTSRMIKENHLMHFPLQKFSTLKPSDFVNLSASNIPQPVESQSSAKKNIETRSTQTDITEDSNLFDDLEDLLRLFKEKKFRYVTLRTANKEFAAHKALLCARSPVFNAMFEMSMKENDNNVVDIDDIDSDTLSSMLQFLHLEPLADLKWEKAAKLYYTADKYQIEQLKSKCLSILKEQLSEENICEAFVLADLHQEDNLKQSALEFFCKNSKIILRTLKWKDLMMERTELASEILSELAERM